MPIVIQAPLGGGDAIHFVHHRLAGTFLGIARKRAEAAISPEGRDYPERLEDVLHAIVYATMALEAAANEIGEDVVPQEQLEEFRWCRRDFARGRPREVPGTIWKWRLLFLARRRAVDPSEEPLLAATRLIRVRNRLTHHRLQEEATKVHSVPPPLQRLPDGSYFRWVWLAGAPVTRVEPGLVVQELVPEKAARYYGAARDVLALWVSVDDPGSVSEFERQFPTVPSPEDCGVGRG